MNRLAPIRDPLKDTWDAVINKILDGLTYVDIIAVDGELAASSDHKVILQLGKNPPWFYVFSRGNFEELGNELPTMKVEYKNDEKRVPNS